MKLYQKPAMTIIELHHWSHLLSGSYADFQGGGILDSGWCDSDGDAWDGSSSSGSGSGLGGWTNNGGDAWE